MSMTTEFWRTQFVDFLQKHWATGDGAHDLHHLHRVWQYATSIADKEGGSIERLVLLCAAYFHDFIALPKDHPERAASSRMSADKALEILRTTFPAFPPDLYPAVHHAIHAHSFSANIPTQTPEAAILQDADRMEALGALGIARLFYTAGRMNGNLFDPEDPLAEKRPLNDKLFALDHIEVKLLTLPATMKTTAGKEMAEERAAYITAFRSRLLSEIAF